MAAEENMEEVAVEQEEKEEEISSEEDPEVKGPRRPKRPGTIPTAWFQGSQKAEGGHLEKKWTYMYLIFFAENFALSWNFLCALNCPDPWKMVVDAFNLGGHKFMDFYW